MTRTAGKLAIFHPAFRSVGGAEILVAAQASSLRRADVEVCVVTLDFDASAWRRWFDGIPVRVVPALPLVDRLAPKVTRLQRIRGNVEACVSDCHVVLASNSPCQAIIGSTPSGPARLWYCNEPSRSLHLAETNPYLHGRVSRNPRGSSDAERDYRRRQLEDRWARRLPGGTAFSKWDVEQTQKLDAIYCISEFSRENVIRIYGRRDATVMPPIVRFPRVRNSRSTGLDRERLRILTQSRLEIPKNVENVLRGYARFARKHASAELHVVGEGTQTAHLEQLAKHLGVERQVHFHGFLTDAALNDLYDHCDVFALQPLDEPFGMVFPEAASRGLLLIGPDHGGPYEIMDGGKLGFASDPFDPEALAESLERILRLSDAEVDALRSRAEHACRSRYSEDVVGPMLHRAIAPSASAVRASTSLQ